MTSKIRSKLLSAAMLILLPPTGVVALYFYGSSTGCSGGDCTGSMMGVLFLGVLAIPVMLAGLLILINLGLTGLGAWVHRRFGKEV